MLPVLRHMFIEPFTFVVKGYKDDILYRYEKEWTKIKISSDIDCEYWIQSSFLTEKNLIKKKLIFFFHGNGYPALNSLEYLEDIIKKTNDSIWVLVDYPYSGTSYIDNTTRPTQEQCYLSSKNIYDEVLSMFNNKKICPTEIILIGRSIGSGIACYLSKKRKNDKLILIHPFSSILEVALGPQKEDNLIKTLTDTNINLFNNRKNIIDTKSRSIRIIHAKDDHFIPIAHSYLLINTIIENMKNKHFIDAQLWIVPNGGHTCNYLRPVESLLTDGSCLTVYEKTNPEIQTIGTNNFCIPKPTVTGLKEPSLTLFNGLISYIQNTDIKY